MVTTKSAPANKTARDLDAYRLRIENLYHGDPYQETGCGGSFAELLAFELWDPPSTGDTERFGFRSIARKWDISVSLLGALIADHCERLEE